MRHFVFAAIHGMRRMAAMTAVCVTGRRRRNSVTRRIIWFADVLWLQLASAVIAALVHAFLDRTEVDL